MKGIRPPDMIRFSGGIADGEMREWRGPWPPDERLGVAVGVKTAYMVMFNPKTVWGETLAELERNATVEFYRRESASKLPDDFESDRVFRGAQYRPERRSERDGS